MWKRIAVIGATAAIIGGAGTAAYAASTTATTTPSPSATSATSDSSATVSKPEAGERARADRIRRAVHATWVTQNKKTGTFTTHDAIRGLSLIHISEPTRLGMISYAVFCLKK